MSNYATQATKIGSGYSVRVLFCGVPLVAARVKTKADIGPALRDLLRTIDKLGGDEFTSAARARKFKPGNMAAGVRHFWQMHDRKPASL
jgi:hypothetical protein